MLRRNWIAFVLTLGLGMTLVGCGQPSATQVVRQLQSLQSNLTSYKSTAMMTVQVQGTAERYFVETWYRAPDQYRIALGNENRDISQIILRNNQGIYIVSPGIKKIIRFQGDWAERQGQLYLYNALLSRIVAASEPSYTTRDKVVTFELGAESINPSVETQRIELAQGTYAPVQVTLLDKKKQPLITMTYLSFDRNVNFPANAFSTDQATTLEPIELPVSAQTQEFHVIEPTWVPQSDTVADETDAGGIAMVRYDGPHPFTLVETRPTSAGQDLGSGQLLTIEGIPAVLLSQGNVHQLYWLYGGLSFALTSRMSIEDIVQVASSTITDMGKS
ncbi:MAG: hypothetical protein OWT28_08375 [Firmicutes bacterium]|nr:hypothetical protein [Bacillota bacterium]